MFVLATVLIALAVLLVLSAGPTAGPRHTTLRDTSLGHARGRPLRPRPTVRPTYGVALAPAAQRVVTHQTFHVASAILFNVWNGQVLWEQNPGVRLPIASLTKMMTALVVVKDTRPTDQVLVTPQAVHFTGSGVGLLPLGKHVSELALLYGLLLPSGNDAAIDLAQHVTHGSESRFVVLMNEQARAMGLTCSHFSNESGVIDQDNYSCTTDLAVLAHAVLMQPLLSRIVGSPSAVLPFPIKGGKLYLYNNNPLMYAGYPGVDGVKTGYTTAAGPCLVAAARRGNVWLGVILLHSTNTAGEAEKLLNAGFARLGAPPD